MSGNNYDDVMTRLLAVEPLPRGERMAREFDAYQPGCAPRSARWWRWMINSLYLARVWGEGSSGIRAHAAPLRRCREQRQRLRAELAERMAPRRRIDAD